MHLFSESEYNNKLYTKLCKFKQNCCRSEKITYKDWSIFTLCAVHSSQSQRKKILIIQGRAELSDKYLPLIYELFNEGFDVYTFDHLGHGNSSRVGSEEFSHIEHFSDYTESTLKVINHFNLQDAYVITNSMGGAIYLKLTENNNYLPTKVVFVAPMIVVKKVNPLIRFLFSNLCNIIVFLQHLLKLSPPAFFGQKKYQKPVFESNYKTHSKQRMEFYHYIYEKSPNLAIGGVTFSWVNQILKNPINKVLHSPSLFLIAENDRIIDNKAGLIKIKQWQQEQSNIKLKIVKNAYHDILNESDAIRNPIIQLIVEFFTNE